MTENTTGYDNSDQQAESQQNDSPESTAIPSAYDRQQDATSEEKDAQIAALQEKLDAIQAQQSSPDQVTSVPPVVPAVFGGSPSGATGPGDVPETAQFHEVPAAAAAETPGGGSTVGDLPLTDTPEVSVDSAPELSDSHDVTPDTQVQNQEELKAAVAEILTLVREIHETVAWVKAEAPKIGAALQDSPFGKMLPTFLNRM